MCNEVIRWELFPNQNWFGWSLVFYTMLPYNSLHGSWFLCPQVQKTKQNKKMEPNNLCNNFLLQNSINPMSAVLSHFSHVLLFVTPWTEEPGGLTVARQAPRSMGFSRPEYGVGCHFLLQGIFLTQGSNLSLSYLLHWHVDSLQLVPPGV